MMVWHRGPIARRKAILDFVQWVTTEAAKDFAPVPERPGPVQSDAVSASLPKCWWSVIARCSLLMGINGVVAPRGGALEICRRSCTLSSGSSIVQAFAFREVYATSPDCCCKITVTLKMPSIAEWDEQTAQTCAIAFGIIAANGRSVSQYRISLRRMSVAFPRAKSHREAKHCAFIVGAAALGDSVKISIGALHERAIRVGAISPVEVVERG